jgi:hypothetical protein
LSKSRRVPDQSLRNSAAALGRAESIDEFEQLIREHSSLVEPDVIDRLDHEIDKIEPGPDDWWYITRARILLIGYREGQLKDALFRCQTRDLILLTPDGVRQRVGEHPELLAENVGCENAISCPRHTAWCPPRRRVIAVGGV